MKDRYNIYYALSDIVKNKNNTFSRITGPTPNELFFKTFNNEEIKEINIKMITVKNINIYIEINTK